MDEQSEAMALNTSTIGLDVIRRDNMKRWLSGKEM
eukprot:CAMPEP_0195579932 /NCGR_PEP_ID=MMETSP0814-20130614/16580_1 /TAXON_ID=97485 /ORGANISM="Prymnesium parvum, Strain Texoma1" /LENGTH=34 /DNA_ID= /DNA_START= /DNA_END= /DNA_ORIENTATION=